MNFLVCVCCVKLWSGPYVEPLLNECWVSVARSESCRPNVNVCVCPALWMAVNNQMLGKRKTSHSTCISMPAGVVLNCVWGAARLLLIAQPQICNWPKHDSICTQFTKQHFSAWLTDGQWYNYNDLLNLSVKPIPEDHFIAQGLLFSFFFFSPETWRHGVTLQSSTLSQMFLHEWEDKLLYSTVSV